MPSVKVRDNLFLCDYIETPFILGILRPKIYLPSSMEPDSAAYVLAHEWAHLKRKDHWWKPLGFALLMLHWFNPMMWLAYILLCRDIETACDERVVRDMALPGSCVIRNDGADDWFRDASMHTALWESLDTITLIQA